MIGWLAGISVPGWWRLALGAALLAFAAGAGWTVRGWRADAAVAELQRQYAEAVAAADRRALEAERAYRAKEAAWTAKLEEIDRGLQALSADLARDAAGARAAAVGVRDAAGRAAAACASAGAAAAGVGASATTAGRVLADVLGLADEIAGRLAEALDRSHAAGRGCERAYDALRQ